MQFLRGIWAWYLGRKVWQRILIAFLLLAVITAPFGSDSQTETATPQPNPSASPSNSPTPEASPEESASPVYVSAVELRSSALGDLADMRKDVSDARKRIDEGGIARLYGNALELSFNVGQLQSLDVSPDLAEEWSSLLTALEAAVDKFSEGLGTDSVSQSKGKLDSISSAISKLESFVKSVK